MRIENREPEPAVLLQGWLASLADPTRTRLLAVLSRHELSVGELVAALQLPQSTVSRHLKVLAGEGWVATRAEGASRYYRLAPGMGAAQQRLWEAIREDLQGGAEGAADEARALQAIELRRSSLEQLFASQTLSWDAERERLFGKGIELRAFPALLDPDWVVADLGCGTGIVAEAMAPHVGRVIGVDTSPYQLKEARRRLRTYGNVELREAALEALPLDSASVDAAVLVLVLHYLPEPRQALREAARVLRPGGRLLVVDMVAHAREEYRLRLGHVWQGFARGQIVQWLGEAGLRDVRYHALPVEGEGPELFTVVGYRHGNGRRRR